jgi:hypothetical protein
MVGVGSVMMDGSTDGLRHVTHKEESQVPVRHQKYGECPK